MAKKAKKAAGGSKTNNPLVVQSKVKEFIKKNKMNCSSDVIGALTANVQGLITQGCNRAKANGRKTLRATDL
ncbi:MAG: hypothetical protein KDD51_05830 [Bdellovibrionales bacterium]|nr:hypothetical protein [Bdellovibrionales bacterium]